VLITAFLAVPALVSSVIASAPIRKAHKLLQLLELVDGAGSGLDADMIQGMTPDELLTRRPIDAATLNGKTAAEIAGDVQTELATSLGAVLSAGYTRVSAASIASGLCNCAQAMCDRPGDALVACNGGVSNDGSGYLTAIDRLTVSGTFVCSACGCTTAGAGSSVGVSASCVTGP
jgi:hypothetical protein